MSVKTDNKPGYEVSASRFTRDDRLLDARGFQRVFREAQRSRDALFTVLSRENDRETARLGLAVSRKSCPSAVHRNRLKRIVRESFRRHKDALRGLDVVAISQAAASVAANTELFDSLAQHWQRCRLARATESRGTGRDG